MQIFFTTAIRKIDLCLVICVNLVSNEEFYLHNKSDFKNILAFLPITFFKHIGLNILRKGCTFYHVLNLCVTTISNKRYMTYKYYIRQPMQLLELNINTIIDWNPHLRNLLSRGANHLLIRKPKHISFIQKNSYPEKVPRNHYTVDILTFNKCMC